MYKIKVRKEKYGIMLAKSFIFVHLYYFIGFEFCFSLKELKVYDFALFANNHSNRHLMRLGVVLLNLQKLIETLAVSDIYDLEMVINSFDFKCLKTNLSLVYLLYNKFYRLSFWLFINKVAYINCLSDDHSFDVADFFEEKHFSYMNGIIPEGSVNGYIPWSI